MDKYTSHFKSYSAITKLALNSFGAYIVGQVVVGIEVGITAAILSVYYGYPIVLTIAALIPIFFIPMVIQTVIIYALFFA